MRSGKVNLVESVVLKVFAFLLMLGTIYYMTFLKVKKKLYRYIECMKKLVLRICNLKLSGRELSNGFNHPLCLPSKSGI